MSLKNLNNTLPISMTLPNLFICKMGNISTGIGGFKLALKNGARPLKLFVNKERIKDIDAFLYYYFEEGIDK